jgi:uncharacterized tellurite resistance protein B-like protein
MLNKFFKSFSEENSSDTETSFESDLYNLVYEVIIADHEISREEIELASSLIHFYFKLSQEENKNYLEELAKKAHFNTDLSQFALRLKQMLSYEQRMDVILICWQVLMVDGKEDLLETSTVRTISSLLGLEDKDFILIRNRVKNSL